jgi:autotransporter strand-loop-strand O-heptosyltransferase
MGIQVVGHTSFLGNTGYNNHSRNFFTHLNRSIPVRIRNYTYVNDVSYLTDEERSLLIEQTWDSPPYKIGTPFIPNPNDLLVNIVLNESHHYYFYDEYTHPMVAYNIWESTRQLPEFFNRILEYDQFWCPTRWQRECTIEQGYPEDKVKVVPEGVNGKLFYPKFNPDIKSALYKKYNIPSNAFTYMIFGRWDTRKATKEMVEAFIDVADKIDNVYLILSADNPFPTDGFKSTEQRLKHYKLEHERIRVLHFPPREEYVNWMRHGDVFLSCSRSEGWNLPLIEAIASGTVSICSEWGGQLDFAHAVAHTVMVPKTLPPRDVFMLGDDHDLGVWGEPDFDHLRRIMKGVYDHFDTNKPRAVSLSRFVRELYSWENAANKAKGYIEELVEKNFTIGGTDIEESDSDGIKLNLGCGNDIRSGYVNIDRYNNTGLVDINSDLGALPFKNNSVSEILTKHVFEHIGLREIYGVVEEWKRVLNPGGKLELYLPNLEREVNIWLNTPDDKKWNEVHRIFGSQSHKGNSHLCGFNPGSLKSFLERFNFVVEKCEVGNSGYGEEIQCIAKKSPNEPNYKTTYICHFVEGPFGEAKGNSQDKSFYEFDFIDVKNNSNVHNNTMGINCWTRPFRKYYTDWLVQIRKNGKLEYEHRFDPAGKNILISFDSKSLGDTIAWFPYVEEFRKKHNCNVWLSTFWNDLFKHQPKYNKIRFITPGTIVQDLYASYTIGCFDNDTNKNKNLWRRVPLQKVCSDIIGLEYKEIKPEIGVHINNLPIKEKYITLSEHSTFQCKYWLYPNGWQTIVDWLNEKGYKVAVISKEKTNLKNIIDLTDKPMAETISNIAYSELFIGVSAGPSWLAWALNIPVVMISGYSEEWAEFKSGVERIINKDVCHGCFNDPTLDFNKGNWNWCPRLENTERQFECTKTITPEMIKEAIERILK